MTKSYARKPGQKWLRSLLLDLTKPGRTRFEALRNISFSVLEGQSVALLGPNGAGKSTILSLVAGLMIPNAGLVEVEGRVSALLDLAAGFHQDLTGRENLVVTASLVGLSRSEVKKRIGGIIEFSGLGDFIDEPIRTYSTGMTMRLAFAVAVSVDPDILLIDEVLAVGDAAFQARCSERIHDLKSRGKILMCVSHSMAIDQLCETAIWLDRGVIRQSGRISDVMAAYLASLTENVKIHQEEALPQRIAAHGTGKRSAGRAAVVGR